MNKKSCLTGRNSGLNYRVNLRDQSRVFGTNFDLNMTFSKGFRESGVVVEPYFDQVEFSD